jgi:hypothetical protein
MHEYLRVTRPYMVLLAIFTVGRLTLGFRGVPYERGHYLFSIVILSLLSSIFYGGFCRKWRGYTVAQALAVGATIGLVSQLVIVVLTVLSYALHAQTYFSDPRAMRGLTTTNLEPISFPTALLIRLGGLVINTATHSVAAAVGWVAGATLPDTRPAA